MNKNPMFALVQNELKAVEAELLSVIHSPVSLVTEIGEHLIQAGGKRLRPALYLLCAKGGQTEFSAKLSVGAAIELIHMATLVHDDVIDNSATRRGIPTANVRWGNHNSVLAGDYLFAKAFSIVAEKVSGRMLKILTDVVCSMCEGEIIQNQNTFNAAQIEAHYLLRIQKKTADFIAASCELGGLSAGFSEKDVLALRQYGHSIGMAFQITDDILDVVSSSEQLGKPVGNDLRQGIVTMPVIYALQNSVHRDELHEIITNREMSDANVQRGLAIVHDTDALKYSYRQVQEHLEQAQSILPVALDPDVRKTLIEIAEFIGLRKY